jgi:methyl-accepting chemotaxis protein
MLSGFTIWFMKDIMNSLHTVMNVMSRIRDGHYRDQVDIKRNDEIGDLYRGLKMMQTNMWNHLAESRERGDEAMRIKQALDVATANIMVADADNNIIYVNDSAKTMFSDAQQDIIRGMPGFDAGKLLGSNIDIFHKDPKHQQALLSALKGAHHASFEIGGRTMKFIANPVFDEQRHRLGTVVEWQDCTAELAVEKEVDSIVAAAQQGDLEQRIKLEGKTGFYYQLGGRINLLIGVIEDSFNEVARVLGALSDGDLTEKITEEYGGKFAEVKNHLNQSVENMDNMMKRIIQTNEFIRTSSEEIVSGNNNLSQRAEQQASTLEETASSMEELTSTVRSNAENAQLGKKKSVHARMIAEKGGDVVNNAITAMDRITASSNKISEIIGVIDEIAFQTNLLALNASVEAARAGDQGRGFAVVASEVRNLAQRSAAAAKEIKVLIRDSVEKVNVGAELVAESGVTLQEIVASVQEVGDIVELIAVASSEQAAGIEEINKAVTQLDEITQQNAALAEQAAASSESSLQKVSEMSELVSFFRISK